MTYLLALEATSLPDALVIVGFFAVCGFCLWVMTR